MLLNTPLYFSTESFVVVVVDLMCWGVLGGSLIRGTGGSFLSPGLEGDGNLYSAPVGGDDAQDIIGGPGGEGGLLTDTQGVGGSLARGTGGSFLSPGLEGNGNLHGAPVGGGSGVFGNTQGVAGGPSGGGGAGRQG